MSIAGIVGAVVCTILVLLIIRLISLAVYKFYTLCKSFLKLDLIITLVFMLTSIFIWYNIEQK